MKNTRAFFRCSHCGNMADMVEFSGAVPVCCGHKMEHLQANTTDASREKHVPVCTVEGNIFKVKVGSVPHPQTQEHHISWIAAAQGAVTQRVMLDHEGAPEAIFCLYGQGDITVYAYCNLHGLWAAEADQL